MKNSLTEKEVLDAISSFTKWPGIGLCGNFTRPYKEGNSPRLSAYDWLPKMLRDLGGKSHRSFFWAFDKKARMQRAMMLAFLLEWSRRKEWPV